MDIFKSVLYSSANEQLFFAVYSTCANATFVCEGKTCPPCSVDQFSCATVHKCIPKGEVCDGIYDCPDKSDEYPLNPSCGKHCFVWRRGEQTRPDIPRWGMVVEITERSTRNGQSSDSRNCRAEQSKIRGNRRPKKRSKQRTAEKEIESGAVEISL